MTWCIACGEKIEAGTKFCTKCGSPQACECGNTNIKGGSYCSRCGKYMADKRPKPKPKPRASVICRSCGQYVTGEVVSGLYPFVWCPICRSKIEISRHGW